MERDTQLVISHIYDGFRSDSRSVKFFFRGLLDRFQKKTLSKRLLFLGDINDNGPVADLGGGVLWVLQHPQLSPW